MIMKTSVLLSWEFPDNHNSPTPYKVCTAASSRRAQLGSELSMQWVLSLGSGISQRRD
jgi:hypothetical protein